VNKHVQVMIACAGLFAGITVYENSEVHWTRKDTAFIWLKGCQLIETCDGYQEALKEAMKDSTLTNSEFWVLKEIYNDGYDKHRMKGLD
tara:strand:+ start:44722 stop:44988 length:267 start_codon:yes stop_codon:yes gene_type:complete